MNQHAATSAGRAGLPRGIWALGFVSMLMDISSEMIHALLPAYLVLLGASTLAVGLIEGIAEATAIMDMNPVLITLGAALFLGEPVGWRRIAGIVAAMIGAMIVGATATASWAWATTFPNS